MTGASEGLLAARFKVVAAGVALVALVLVLLVASGTVTSACNDDLSFTGPNAEFSVDYDDSSETVRVVHQSGDTLAKGWTEELFLVITTADGAASTNYSITDGPESFPISPETRFSVRNVSINDRSLTQGDVLNLVWRGTEKPLPAYCLTERSDSTSSMVLVRHVVN